MPPRKSDARKSEVSAVAEASSHADAAPANDSVLSATTSPAAEARDDSITAEGAKMCKETAAAAAAADHDKTTIEDLTLPKSIITRLAKGVLPANTQIQANAIMAMSKSTTVFISYLAAHANDITLSANKKTIMPADVFKALEEIEFDFLKEPLEAEFAKFNAIQTDKRNTYRQKVKAAVKTPGDDTEMAGGVADTTTASALTDDDDDEAPRSKKARIEVSAEETDAEDPEEDAAEEMDDEEEDEEEAEDEDEEDEGRGRETGDETQDALEEMVDREQEEADEALDGDESD